MEPTKFTCLCVKLFPIPDSKSKKVVNANAPNPISNSQSNDNKEAEYKDVWQDLWPANVKIIETKDLGPANVKIMETKDLGPGNIKNMET